MTKKSEMYTRIQRHGEQMNAIFNTPYEPIQLCKKLRLIENKQSLANERYCSDKNYTAAMFEHDCELTEKAVIRVLGIAVPVYINTDPRGYALKIDDDLMRAKGYRLHTDVGGYGILAPDLT